VSNKLVLTSLFCFDRIYTPDHAEYYLSSCLSSLKSLNLLSLSNLAAKHLPDLILLLSSISSTRPVEVFLSFKTQIEQPIGSPHETIGRLKILGGWEAFDIALTQPQMQGRFHKLDIRVEVGVNINVNTVSFRNRDLSLLFPKLLSNGYLTD